MNDFEDRLRRYRPAGPAADLRARLVDGARSFPERAEQERNPWWAWLPAAAAAGVAIVFYALSARSGEDVIARLSAGESVRAAAVNDLATQLGGDAFAAFEAERLIEIDNETVSDSAQFSGSLGLQVTSHD